MIYEKTSFLGTGRRKRAIAQVELIPGTGKITVNGKNCFIQDLNSSNGTFVNGKIIKKVTVEDKDKITLPNVIFQLVYVKEIIFFNVIYFINTK